MLKTKDESKKPWRTLRLLVIAVNRKLLYLFVFGSWQKEANFSRKHFNGRKRKVGWAGCRYFWSKNNQTKILRPWHCHDVLKFVRMNSRLTQSRTDCFSLVKLPRLANCWWRIVPASRSDELINKPIISFLRNLSRCSDWLKRFFPLSVKKNGGSPPGPAAFHGNYLHNDWTGIYLHWFTYTHEREIYWQIGPTKLRPKAFSQKLQPTLLWASHWAAGLHNLV